ncbi:MAG: hypothetical protein RLZZ234_754 [Candidatus Parcubacteria bacterium]|jgi:hypothetical protein
MSTIQWVYDTLPTWAFALLIFMVVCAALVGMVNGASEHHTRAQSSYVVPHTPTHEQPSVVSPHSNVVDLATRREVHQVTKRAKALHADSILPHGGNFDGAA